MVSVARGRLELRDDAQLRRMAETSLRVPGDA
jgi:hypothetical protein